MNFNPMSLEQQKKKQNIEAKKYQNCVLFSYEEKITLIVPLANILGGPYDDPSRPPRYIDSNPDVINHEIMIWALDLANAYYDAYKYFQGEERDIFIKSALNLSQVSYFVSRELKAYKTGIQAQELDLQLGKEIGAPEEDLQEIRHHIAWLNSLMWKKF